jgi:hypothetical protein
MRRSRPTGQADWAQRRRRLQEALKAQQRALAEAEMESTAGALVVASKANTARRVANNCPRPRGRAA